MAGPIRRELRRTASGDWNSNVYHLDGLVERIQRLEPDFREAKERRREAKRRAETPAGTICPGRVPGGRDDWAAGDRTRALELYALNTRISEALYTPLQMLEKALRNRIHAVMTEAHHERWFDDEGFLVVENQRRQLAIAIAEVMRERKEVTSGRLVAALTFSFWSSMLSPDYEALWQTTLHRIARREDGKHLRRKDLSAPLAPIRSLRNRVAHHEPVLQWNLPKHYANIVQITGWLSPAAAAWCRTHSRFDAVYPLERIDLA